MRNDARILVVGTTSDYIDWLRQAAPGRVLFLTDPSVRRMAREPVPTAKEEILCDLTRFDRIRSALSEHLQHRNISLAGITCFDCESLGLAAFLAEDLGLFFPSVASIRICRDKYAMSSRWQKSGVATPRFALARTADDAADFMARTGKACVLKPLSGSGSELVFLSDSENDCRRSARLLLDGIGRRRGNRLYGATADCFLIEEYIKGIEYSCDFLVEKEGVKILRFSRKIKAEDAPFGTTIAYVLTTCEKEGIQRVRLEALLGQAARALGLTGAVCMADFLVGDGGVSFLEVSPRPGGDCIPFLLQLATGLDILRFTLDFAEKLPLEIPSLPEDARYVGLRLHAQKPGRIKTISAEDLCRDQRVKDIHLIRRSGHAVVLPPEDYDSWYLGHVLFIPDNDKDVEGQCHAMRRRLSVEMEA
jgi:biotin carboxylase